MLLFLIKTEAQNVPLYGARQNGLAYASACLQDEWSVFNNIAGMADVKKLQAGFTYDARPYLKSFDRMAVAVVNPIKIGSLGVGASRMGDDLYNEHVLAVGFSNHFGLASLGIRANYIQYRAEGFGSAHAITISFGGIAQLTPAISVGAHIVNINQPKISTISDERIPTYLMAGVAIHPTEKVLILSEIEKDIDHAPKWKTALEYQAHKKLSFRTGFTINPGAAFFGFGFKAKFSLDYAFQYHPEVGGSHQATVGYTFPGKKK
ncbi:MAG: hypothetical protein JNM57_04555 [Cyclobacteriaceae bacterium]|nr:hypothetical protein [Cyclobacteriaceae bacterium]